ncbi:YdeI family protein [Nocardioides sp. zg-1228]|uniref:YdeI/OmpD-associated family protein n=1 Tax=Nocardioides sp. zg-1228 TaxID=2763008 RepID=UPI0016426D00|nr:YdeI/OmpD-associated family protein [Nocardioides sp. zg-1228]MBC2933277.1 YdeI/OmpD-associated family protein [Nocardioides sp. zg-1228]QSF56559.1 YdeI/OmpD-associated family protein [Nocardioides sp. zg-1228]
MGAMDDAERLEPRTVEEWSAWLVEHHRQPDGVWLVSPRRATERPFTYEVAVLEALRYGWVDSTVKPLDEQRSMQWFAPRRRGSMWTRINKGRIARLQEAGLLEPAGAAAVAVAKETGMWTLMDAVEDLVVPDDLAAAFERHPGAREHWESWSASAQKLILTWIVLAKRPETRAARVETTAEKAGRGERSR